MMFRISKRFEFSAAHHLPQLPGGHKCSRPHGHNYVVRVVLEARELDEFGFVQDYGDLVQVKSYLDSVLDHQDLNEVLTFPTTAENLAQHLFTMFVRIYPYMSEVLVSETPNTTASYRK